MSKSTKDTLFLILALAVGFAINQIPPSGALTKEGVSVLAVFATSLMMWITISIDWPSMITILLLGFLPSFGFPATLRGAFGNSTVAFLIFTFMLVYPLSQTSFVRRCTVGFITNSIARRGPWAFVTFLFAAVTFMGLFISPSVLFVAFMPFLEDIFKVLEIKKGGKTGNLIMMGTAFCISMSSGMTAIGHVWPTLAMGYYAAATGKDINQFQFMAMGIPTGIILLILLLLVFKYIYRPDDINDINPEKAMSLRGTIPAATRKEKIILAVMLLTVVLWVGPSLIKGINPGLYKYMNGMTTAMPPLLGCILLFVITDNGQRIMNFKEVSTKGVLWASILMTGAATMIGSALTNNKMGIEKWLSQTLSPVTSGLPMMGLIIFFVTWCVIETNFSSNIVTTTVVSAVALTVLTALPAGSVNIAAVISLIGFGAAICNMTPAGQSTINTVAIGSGWTTTKDMFIWGGVFSVLAILVMSFIGYNIATLVM
jgi:sodium-dependent dicarboxylate transporter 2/3/5